jgi:hypothetical protein
MAREVHAGEGLKPPSKLLLLAEFRAVGELALGLASLPLLASAPRGDGHTVLVLPGFLTSDKSTEFLRGVLSHLGYNAVGWNMGRNTGGLYSRRAPLREKLESLQQESGRRVSVVGWSLGGVYARDLALAAPEHVRRIVTLGTPFSGNLRANNVGRLYDRVSGENPEHARPADIEALAGDLPVPATSIYSRTDGIVHWRTSRGQPSDNAENIEVWGASHIGLGVNPAVVWAVADRLAQPDGQFTPFGHTGPFSLAYRH